MATKKNSIFTVVLDKPKTLNGLEPEKGAMVWFNGQVHVGNGTTFEPIGGGGGGINNAIILESN